MRWLVVVLVVAGVSADAVAGPPSPADARFAADRWARAARRHDVAALAAATRFPLTIDNPSLTTPLVIRTKRELEDAPGRMLLELFRRDLRWLPGDADAKTRKAFASQQEAEAIARFELVVNSDGTVSSLTTTLCCIGL